ncbi:T9SS type A sorting domain-containing protein [Winogradskyella helgolandensis]|uniref:T9SS type A sorting domain-containing protein n=1 Tax=Winogradskyella helgolandensis TaxID=2697010 RepID=UPI0015CD0A73|nr:T9SS type A sorting domain-containing protein [Winogradskyella helgolandensis]
MKKLLLLFILIPLLNFGQVQIGQDIFGDIEDRLGFAVSSNSDGSIIAVSSPNNENATGYVRVYENINDSWTQIGQDITGDFGGDKFGFSVSLSSDGSIIAISAPYRDGGIVKVFENVSNNWVQLGADIIGESEGDVSGYSISLSGNGDILAIGTPYGSSTKGHIRIFENISGVWTQNGSNIEGENVFDFSAVSVSLSKDGSTVAEGSYLNGANGDWSGQARVFKNISGVWTQIGANFNGETGDFLGISISLNSNGTVLAIGATKGTDDDINYGQVKVYRNIDSNWSQIGSNINATSGITNFGSAVDLNSNGTILAIGDNSNDDNGLGSGEVKIFENENENWTQIGTDINGESVDDFLGYSLSLNSLGTTIVISAGGNDGNGLDSGQVKVYDLSSIVNSQTTLIPDMAFEQALIDQSIDSDGILNGEVLTSDISSLTTLNVMDSGISDLTGIEDFVNLTSLRADINELTSIDVSNNTNLTSLIVTSNQLTSIDVSNNTGLTFLALAFNQLTNLDVSNNTNLITLGVSYNELTTIDLSNNINLEEVIIFNNQLTSINVSNITGLIDLYLGFNQLTNIDLSSNVNLDLIYINNNLLTSIDLTSNNQLGYVILNDNSLTSLNIQNGSNTLIDSYFIVNGNSDLLCIQVDDVNYSETNWTTIDLQTSFSTDCSALSIVDFNQNSFKIFPNPAKDQFTIQLDKLSNLQNVSIYNNIGQLILTSKETTIDSSKLASGLYVVEIETNRGKSAKKLIIE